MPKRHQLKAGREYEAFAPNGLKIIGTYDVLYAVANTNSFKRSSAGTVEPEYEGESEILWNSQSTDRDENNMALYVDSSGNVWPEDKLTFKVIPE